MITLYDCSTAPSPRRARILLAEKFGSAFLPKDGAARAECLSWLFWQMGSAPFVGGGFGHFYAYAPVKIEYAIDRYAMEAKRQLDVLNQRLAVTEYVAGNEYTHVVRWAEQVAKRPAVQRGRKVNRVNGDLASQLRERHDASDFDTKTQDKIEAAASAPSASSTS